MIRGLFSCRDAKRRRLQLKPQVFCAGSACAAPTARKSEPSCTSCPSCSSCLRWLRTPVPRGASSASLILRTFVRPPSRVAALPRSSLPLPLFFHFAGFLLSSHRLSPVSPLSRSSALRLCNWRFGCDRRRRTRAGPRQATAPGGADFLPWQIKDRSFAAFRTDSDAA